MVGMLYIAWLVGGMAGGVGAVVAHASEAGKLEFFPKRGAKEWLAFVAAWITMGSARSRSRTCSSASPRRRTRRPRSRGSVLGGSVYFCFAFVPMFLAYSAR